MKVSAYRSLSVKPISTFSLPSKCRLNLANDFLRLDAGHTTLEMGVLGVIDTAAKRSDGDAEEGYLPLVSPHGYG